MLTPEWTPLLTVIQMISAVASWHPEAAGVDRHDALCLARNIYFEARGEGSRGQYAVAAVTLNRVRDKRWSGRNLRSRLPEEAVFMDHFPTGVTADGDRRPCGLAAGGGSRRAVAGRAGARLQPGRHPLRSARASPADAGLDEAMAVSHRIDGHVFFADQGRDRKGFRGHAGPTQYARRSRRWLSSRGPHPPRWTPALVKEVQREGRAAQSLHLRRSVNVDANYLLPCRQCRRNGQPARPAEQAQSTPSDPWNDPAGNGDGAQDQDRSAPAGRGVM